MQRDLIFRHNQQGISGFGDDVVDTMMRSMSATCYGSRNTIEFAIEGYLDGDYFYLAGCSEYVVSDER